MEDAPKRLSLATTALLISFIPFVAVHSAWIVSSMQNAIPTCIPYLEGCVTISRAARSSGAVYFFKICLGISSPLLVWYWLQMYEWIRPLAYKRSRGIKSMRFLGIVGAVFLLLYVIFLGTEGEYYRWMRRYGVTIYFSFTALAQILLVRQLLLLKHHKEITLPSHLITTKLLCCIFQWGIGITSLPLAIIFTGETKDMINNIVEWNFALAMNSFFFLSYFLLKNLKRINSRERFSNRN